jgi:very-short-patch-repair endonuclease
MFPRKSVPELLKAGPVPRAQALAAGVGAAQLRGPNWKRMARGIYVWAGLPETPLSALEALAHRLPPGSAFSGMTAARVFGLELGLDQSGGGVCAPGFTTAPYRRLDRSARFSGTGDTMCHQGLPVTSPTRTFFDLARLLQRGDGVAALDWALHNRWVLLLRLQSYLDERPRWPGIKRARRALAVADGRSESPMESRLRVILLDAGLPPPDVQVWVGDRRIDMAYRDVKLGIEYDGDTHRDRLVEDNRRQNWLVAAGYVLLRFTAADVYQRPAAIAAQVGAQLRARC